MQSEDPKERSWGTLEASLGAAPVPSAIPAEVASPPSSLLRLSGLLGIPGRGEGAEQEVLGPRQQPLRAGLQGGTWEWCIWVRVKRGGPAWEAGRADKSRDFCGPSSQLGPRARTSWHVPWCVCPQALCAEPQVCGRFPAAQADQCTVRTALRRPRPQNSRPILSIFRNLLYTLGH